MKGIPPKASFKREPTALEIHFMFRALTENRNRLEMHLSRKVSLEYVELRAKFLGSDGSRPDLTSDDIAWIYTEVEDALDRTPSLEDTRVYAAILANIDISD